MVFPMTLYFNLIHVWDFKKTEEVNAISPLGSPLYFRDVSNFLVILIKLKLY